MQERRVLRWLGGKTAAEFRSLEPTGEPDTSVIPACPTGRRENETEQLDAHGPASKTHWAVSKRGAVSN